MTTKLKAALKVFLKIAVGVAATGGALVYIGAEAGIPVAITVKTYILSQWELLVAGGAGAVLITANSVIKSFLNSNGDVLSTVQAFKQDTHSETEALKAQVNELKANIEQTALSAQKAADLVVSQAKSVKDFKNCVQTQTDGQAFMAELLSTYLLKSSKDSAIVDLVTKYKQAKLLESVPALAPIVESVTHAEPRQAVVDVTAPVSETAQAVEAVAETAAAPTGQAMTATVKVVKI